MAIDPADLESDELVIQPPAADTAVSPPEPPAEVAAEDTPDQSSQAESPAADGPDLDAFVAKLTPEQKKALVGKFDTDELFELNERLSGRLGTLARKQALDIVKAQDKTQQDATLRAQRDEAIKNREPDQALQVLETQTAHEQQEAGDRAFERASATFASLLADPRLGELLHPLAGKNYGEIAAKSGVPNHAVGLTAATLFDMDMAQIVHELPTRLPEWEKSVRSDVLKDADKDPDVRARVEKDLRPAIEKELRARLELEEPPVDKGSGHAPAHQTDDDFAREFAQGKSNDLGRATRWLDSLTDTPALARG